jgi:hypothetical protein
MRIESRTIELDTNNSSIKVFYWIKSYDSISFDSVFLTVGYPLVAETIGFNHEVAFLSSSYIKSIVNLDIIGVDSIRDVNRQHKVDRS